MSSFRTVLVFSLISCVISNHLSQSSFLVDNSNELLKLVEEVERSSADHVVEDLLDMMEDPVLNKDEDVLKATMIRFVEEPRIREGSDKRDRIEAQKIRVPRKLLQLLRSELPLNLKKRTLDQVVLRLKKKKAFHHPTLEIVKHAQKSLDEDILFLAPASDSSVRELPRIPRAKFSPSFRFQPATTPLVFQPQKIPFSAFQPSKIPKVFHPNSLPLQFLPAQNHLPFQPSNPAIFPPRANPSQFVAFHNPSPFNTNLTPFSFNVSPTTTVKPEESTQTNSPSPGTNIKKQVKSRKKSKSKTSQQPIKLNGRKKAFKVKLRTNDPQKPVNSPRLLSLGPKQLSSQKLSSFKAHPQFDVVTRAELFDNQDLKIKSFRADERQDPKKINKTVPKTKNQTQQKSPRQPKKTDSDDEEENLGFPESYGVAGRDFPTYDHHAMPSTSFTCDGLVNGGLYADPEARCQMYHMCVADSSGGNTKFSFLCPNGTLFNQETLSCGEWFKVDCSEETVSLLSQLNLALEKERDFITSGLEVSDPLEDLPWRNRDISRGENRN